MLHPVWRTEFHKAALIAELALEFDQCVSVACYTDFDFVTAVSSLCVSSTDLIRRPRIKFKPGGLYQKAPCDGLILQVKAVDYS